MQVNRQFTSPIYALYSANTDLYINSGLEFIVLDHVSIPSVTNFALIIKNNSSVGQITDVTVYASPNATNYYILKSYIFDRWLQPNTISSIEFTGVSLFLRITVQSNAPINMDVHLHGSLT